MLFIGAVGDDSFGNQLTAALVAGGVSVERLRHTAGPSGTAAITVDDNAENSIVVVAAANGTVIGLTDADRNAVRSAGMLLCQLEIPMAAVVSATGVASAAGIPVLLNPLPARELPSELLAAVTVLVVNEGEAAAIGSGAIAGVPHVVTTLGGAGAHYRGPDEEFRGRRPEGRSGRHHGCRRCLHRRARGGLGSGLRPREAIQSACAAGALATTSAGASSSSPTEAEITELAESRTGNSRDRVCWGLTHPTVNPVKWHSWRGLPTVARHDQVLACCADLRIDAEPVEAAMSSPGSESATTPGTSGPTSPGRGPNALIWRWWNLLLLLPLLMLITPWFNKDKPRLFGMPFFYWYQMAFVFVGVACVSIVYAATRTDPTSKLPPPEAANPDENPSGTEGGFAR